MVSTLSMLNSMMTAELLELLLSLLEMTNNE
jgi:hypothetical protein